MRNFLHYLDKNIKNGKSFAVAIIEQGLCDYASVVNKAPVRLEFKTSGDPIFI